MNLALSYIVLQCYIIRTGNRLIHVMPDVDDAEFAGRIQKDKIRVRVMVIRMEKQDEQ